MSQVEVDIGQLTDDSSAGAMAPWSALSATAAFFCLAALALWAGRGLHASARPGTAQSKRPNLRRRLGALLDDKDGWTKGRRCSGEELRELMFVVQPKNLDRLEATVLDLTDPSSPNYRRWLTRLQLDELTRNDDALSALKTALAGQPEVQTVREAPGGELLRASAPARTWERFLGTQFHLWHHWDSNTSVLRAAEFTLPDPLQAHVDCVLEAADFELAHAQAGSPESRGSSTSLGFEALTQSEKKAVPRDIITPARLRQIYNMPPISERGSELAKQEANVSQVIFGTIGQHWSPSDRTKFEEIFKIPQDSYVKQLDASVQRGFAMSGDAVCREASHKCMEANLDVQYIMAMAPWAKTGYWYTPEGTAEGMYQFLVDFSEHFADAESVPDVVSISYGVAELAVPVSVRRLFDLQAMKLAARGVTILVASGDSGADEAGGFALRRGDKSCIHLEIPRLSLQVSWPAASRWVTAVGATVGSATGHRDVVCSVNATVPSVNETVLDSGATHKILITSGGGYSRDSQPAWQAGHGSGQGRGVPDLSLNGHAYVVAVGGRLVLVDGTSASAPTLGGMISLINAKLKAKGKPSVGFLNPLIYKSNSSAVFFDVTEGDNRCARRGAPCCGGYDAAPGWDPTTGLGVPDFARLEALILAAAGLGDAD